MSNNFQKPSVELTEELAQAIEKAAENFDKPAKKVMGLRGFMTRILPTLKTLREEKGATWSEIAEFLGKQIGHEYSENHIRVIYLSIVSKETSKKVPKQNLKKDPKENTAVTPSKITPPGKPSTEISSEPEKPANKPAVTPDPVKPKREYRPPPDMIIQGTKDPFN
jgi:hypothetical protein